MKSLRSIIVEDSSDDAALMLRHLSDEGYDVKARIVQTPEEMKAALAEGDWDVVLSDYTMPHFSSKEALSLLRETDPDIPFIIVSGTIGEDIAVQALLEGVDDYLLKGNFTRLGPAIDRELENAANRERQKQTKQALLASEASLANAQRIAHLGNWMWDLKSDEMFGSEETYRIYGVQNGLASDFYQTFSSSIHPEDRKRVRSATEAAISGKDRFEVEHRLLRPDGEERTVCQIGEVVRDTAGKATLVTGTVQDITARKSAEEEMRVLAEQVKNEHVRLNKIVATVPGVVWESWGKPNSPEHRVAFVSDYLETMLGYTAEEWGATPNFWLNVVHPDDREKALQNALLSYERGVSDTDHFRWIRKDGGIVWVETQSVPVLDESGKSIGMRGVNLDITARRLAEEAIIESEEKYRNIVETASEGIWLLDRDGSTTYVNRQMEEMLGYEAAEILGKKTCAFLFEDDCSLAGEKFEKFKQDHSAKGEFRLRRKDGSELTTLYNASPVKDHAGEVVGYLSMNTDITERKKADSRIQKAEAKYRSLVESSPGIVILTEPDPPFKVIYVSPNIEAFGYTPDEWYADPDMWSNILHSEDRERAMRISESPPGIVRETEMEYRIIARDGSTHWWQSKGRFVYDDEGDSVGWQRVILDITTTKELEQQLHQAQKLESVGMLAGGIAHDFNNMLTAINGYSDLTLRHLREDDPLRHNIEEIRKAGQRSSVLTNQLLAFSRRQILQPVVLDLNAAISETIRMLQMLIGEDIQLSSALDPRIGRVIADPGQFSQLIMNLAVNARDAMPAGGKLTIETSNVVLDQVYTWRHVGLFPGPYVMMAVSDTGTGMSERIQKQIFEPFFTTKEVGRGTGLGLATVYGIVKQSGGNIEVYSEEGVGSTFKVYLPRVAESVDTLISSEALSNMPAGTETILLVEDEPIVRDLTRRILTDCGYEVIEAENGLKALAICESGVHIDLLLTDVVMPKMGGRELAAKLTEKCPDVLILFTSGYTDDAVVRHGVIGANTNFIQKPFSPELLANKIREILDGS